MDTSRHPDYQRDELKAIAPDLQLIADLLGGTRAMQESPQLARYIPQWPDERDGTWMKRTRAATLFEGFSRVLSASVGMLFAQPPRLEFPTGAAALEPHWQDIDGAGTHGHVVAKRVAEAAIADGHALLLVDFPVRPEGAVTAATEAELNLRARWALYPRASILSWRTAVVRNRLTCVQCVLHEPTTEPEGTYGVAVRQRFRVLAIRDGVAGYELWQKPEGAGEAWTLLEAGVFTNRRGETRDTLPIAVAYAGRTDAPFTSQPPLLGVAYANLSHWQNKTELHWGSKISGIEQFIVTGELAKDPTTLLPTTGVKIGWEHFVHLQQGATAEWKGPSGKGLDQLRQRVAEAEQEMAALGMSFLSRDTRAAETAEAKRLDASAENASLATAAQGVEDALNLAWAHHAWFEGLEAAQAPTIALNRDFERVTLDAAMIGAIGALVREGLPIPTAVEMLAKGGVIPTTDPAALDQLALEWEAGQSAARDMAEMRADTMTPPTA